MAGTKGIGVFAEKKTKHARRHAKQALRLSQQHDYLSSWRGDALSQLLLIGKAKKCMSYTAAFRKSKQYMSLQIPCAEQKRELTYQQVKIYSCTACDDTTQGKINQEWKLTLICPAGCWCTCATLCLSCCIWYLSPPHKQHRFPLLPREAGRWRQSDSCWGSYQRANSYK